MWRHKDMQPDFLPRGFVERCNALGRTRQPFLFVIDFRGEAPRLWPLDALDPGEVQFEIGPWRNTAPAQPCPRPFRWHIEPPAFARYADAFAQVQAALHRGDSYLVNLTLPTRIETDLSLHDIFLHSEAWCRLWWRDRFVVFSPEKFVCIEGRTISTYPMKGTIDATLPDALQRLLADEKERAEHMTIVDLLRNDLARVAREVHVRRLRYLDLVHTQRGKLWQASSEICGTLPATWPEHLGTLLSALLPAGSVTGAPKRRTVEIIEAAEQYPRGYYTGIAGLFDGQALYSAVLIRFVEQTTDGLVYKSGGGITTASDAWKEYEELIAKVYLPFRQKAPTAV